MAMMKSGRVAVVGMGPRGLGAIEALAERMDDARGTLDVEIFDPVPHPGAGPNFSPEQSDLCLLNIPLREISLDPPGFSGARLGTFSDFLTPPVDPETYPPRSHLGAYLEARLRDVLDLAPGLRATRRAAQALEVDAADGAWWIGTSDGRFGPYDEVLLTQGQPATEPDEQLARWRESPRAEDLIPAYPANALLDAAQRWTGRNVAIRDLALATLDVMRLLTFGMGGRVEDGRYHRSGREPARILPFSLNGHPPLPKPAHEAQDKQFDPLPEETRAFEAALARATAAGPEAALRGLCDVLRAPATRILRETGSSETGDDVVQWLNVESDTPGEQETRAPVEALRIGIEMAHGRIPPSTGYVIGQLWRKWQDALRRGFNSATIDPETAKALIGFDEGLKRYSYGPPVRSAADLLMLIEDGLVDLRAVEDPDIAVSEDGWRLADDDATATAWAMVDAVMPSPALDGLTDPLLTGLMRDGRMVAAAEGLGAVTQPDGQLVDRHGQVQQGLCLLGRLALGSVIAADSIHDCLGAASRRWADGVVARIGPTAPAPHAAVANRIPANG